MNPVSLAGLLYLGAFTGLFLYSLIRKIKSKNEDGKYAPLEKKDVPWLAGAVITGGILAPISLMIGLTLITGLSTSLLLNLEGVATAVIAVFLFKENAGARLWLALLCMTLAGIFLSWDPTQGKFSIIGPLLIVFAMFCWGLDNNLTRNISDKDPIQITQVKGLIGGSTSIVLALILGLYISFDFTIISALLLGFFSYGISIVFFIQALKGLGSFRTGAFFSFAPFIGAVVSLVLLREWIGWVIFPATGFMIIGLWLIISEKHAHIHIHPTVIHTHSHVHNDIHHLHTHAEPVRKEHTHEHIHTEMAHNHIHFPDIHHRHKHKPKKKKRNLKIYDFIQIYKIE